MSKTITISDDTWEKIRDQVEEEKKPKGVKILDTDGKVLYQSTKDTTREALVEAVKENANLRGASLQGANLQGADLRGADLKGADTRSTMVNFSEDEYEQAKQFIEGLKN